MLPDINLAQLQYSIEVVAVWQLNSLIDPDNISFYTDTNSLEVVERIVDPKLNLPIP